MKVVISDLAGQRIKKVTSLVKEKEQTLKALVAQKMPKTVPELVNNKKERKFIM